MEVLFFKLHYIDLFLLVVLLPYIMHIPLPCILEKKNFFKLAITVIMHKSKV